MALGRELLLVRLQSRETGVLLAAQLYVHLVLADSFALVIR